jgi:hypothetical protein
MIIYIFRLIITKKYAYIKKIGKQINVKPSKDIFEFKSN